jgi:hypothetical protein
MEGRLSRKMGQKLALRRNQPQLPCPSAEDARVAGKNGIVLTAPGRSTPQDDNFTWALPYFFSLYRLAKGDTGSYYGAFPKEASCSIGGDS